MRRSALLSSDMKLYITKLASRITEWAVNLRPQALSDLHDIAQSLASDAVHALGLDGRKGPSLEHLDLLVCVSCWNFARASQ